MTPRHSNYFSKRFIFQGCVTLWQGYFGLQFKTINLPGNNIVGPKLHCNAFETNPNLKGAKINWVRSQKTQ